jgi:hypothetical protein
MDTPKTYEVNTPRLIVKFLTKIVKEINDINKVITPLKEQLAVEVGKQIAAETAKREKEAIAKAKAQKLVQAKEDAANRIAAAKAMIAKVEAKKQAEKDEAKALADAKALLKKETSK